MRRGGESDIAALFRLASPGPDPRSGAAPSESIRIAGLHGGAVGWALAEVCRQAKTPLLVVAPTLAEATALKGDLTFFLGEEGGRVMSLPSWDVEPYDVGAPHAMVSRSRLAALNALRDRTSSAVIIAPPEALIKRVMPLHEQQRLCLHVRANDALEREELLASLVSLGYLATDLVEDEGCFAVRGGVVDIFPPGLGHPVRLELEGDFVEAIRAYDPQTQRSIRRLPMLSLFPIREEALTPERVTHANLALKAQSDAQETPTAVRRLIAADLELGITFPGIEYYLGVLYPSLSSIFDYVEAGDAPVVVWEPSRVQATLKEYEARLTQRYRAIDPKVKLIPPPETLFLSSAQLEEHLGRHTRLQLTSAADPSRGGSTVKTESTASLRALVLAEAEQGAMLKPLVTRLSSWRDEGLTPSVVCHSETQAGRLEELLQAYGVSFTRHPNVQGWPGRETLEAVSPGTIHMLIGELSEGFRFKELGIVCVSEIDIFGVKVKTGSVGKQYLRNALSDFAQLNRGDPVVHRVHGIGVFRGLTRLEVDGHPNDFLQLEYREGDKLYLPVHRLSELQRYISSGALPTLDKLGGSTFAKTRRVVKRNVLELARSLLKLQAARLSAPGYAYHFDAKAVAEFESTFSYDETTDQLQAIRAVYQDMAAERPMDRLICGDVGYGKTEVAIRAAYVAVLNGRQVAVLVPTTVLALQHFRTFSARFERQAIRVEMLNRFRSQREQTSVLDAVKAGRCDIVIGTHRLLSDDVVFKDLGLLVVDEEHRFGVTHKERIKRFKTLVDVLAMSATPIPRTLHMAVNGLREFSLITTPPRDRLSIRTYHVERTDERVRDAITFELKRGGQVYFVHNRVENIEQTAQWLQTLVPEVKVGVAHGQMGERQLERVMIDFIERRYHVLCCSTIIESGLDIPSVNTLLVDDADHFGMSQLYQLRGRVGRSSERAYAYLLTRANHPLSSVAERRLQTLVEASELGSGFRVAMEDLELRGAGELLGDSQSGHVQAVGLDMYCSLLEEAVAEVRGETASEQREPELELDLPAYLPEDYISDFHLRLHYYKQLSDATDETSLYERFEELEDRFGPYPEEVKNLMGLMSIKIMLRQLAIVGLVVKGGKVVIRIDEGSRVSRARLVSLAREAPSRWKLLPDGRLVVSLNGEEWPRVVSTVKNLLRKISERAI